MELRVSDNGQKFADVFVPADVTLFADGTAEESPYFWVLGAEFGVRADIVPEGCSGSFCMDDAPVWRVQVFERTVNAPGGEFTPTEALIQGHLAEGVAVSEAVADTLYAMSEDPLAGLSAYVEPEGNAARFIAWTSAVSSELMIWVGTEAFASLVFDEA